MSAVVLPDAATCTVAAPTLSTSTVSSSAVSQPEPPLGIEIKIDNLQSAVKIVGVEDPFESGEIFSVYTRTAVGDPLGETQIFNEMLFEEIDDEKRGAATEGKAVVNRESSTDIEKSLNKESLTNGEASAEEDPQQRWMRKFLKEEKATFYVDYMRKFMSIRMEQESLRSIEEFSTTTAAAAPHYIRNRYRDILPYDANRVRLKGCSAAENPDGYINASHIQLPNGKTKFIAAQAPLPTTLDEFWQMIDEQGVRLIVMLCKLVEMSKVKCELYWPEKLDTAEVYGDYEVKFENEERFDDDEYVLRTLSLKKNQEGGERRSIHQLHYREWPDHGCPAGYSQLLNMIELMSSIAKADGNCPVLVHCSAGVGRTGTIIAVNHVRELIQQNLATDVDVFQLVLALRKQRSSMVQTQDQFHFVHRCVAHYCRRALNLPDEVADEDSGEGEPDEMPKAERVVSLPTLPPSAYAPQIPHINGLKSDSEDEEGTGSAVPDYPEEPKAPQGPEDFSTAV